MAAMHYCPKLGLPEDPNSHYSFPTPGNRCYAVAPPGEIRPEYQESICLTGGHPRCIRLGGDVTVDDHTRPGAGKGVRFFAATVVALLMIVVAVAVFFPDILPGGIDIRGIGAPSGQETALASPPVTSPAATATVASAAILGPDPTSSHAATSALPSLTAVPTYTPTISPTPWPLLETPFGPSARYLVHSVVDGESLGSLAERYGTSEAVLGHVNALDPDVELQTDVLIVVAPGRTDPTGLPALQALWIGTPRLVNDLAVEYGTSPAELRYQNGLSPDEWVEPGRYIVVPRLESLGEAAGGS